MTEWLDHGETKGKRANSLLENLASMAKFILKFKRTRLLRCAWNAGSWSCSAATSERFQMANGLATTPDRRFVFVSDPTALEVVVYRSQAGKLSRVTSFAPKHSVDNLEVVESRLSADEVALPVHCKSFLWMFLQQEPHDFVFFVPGSAARRDGPHSLHQWGRLRDGSEHDLAHLGPARAPRLHRLQAVAGQFVGA